MIQACPSPIFQALRQLTFASPVQPQWWMPVAAHDTKLQFIDIHNTHPCTNCIDIDRPRSIHRYWDLQEPCSFSSSPIEWTVCQFDHDGVFLKLPAWTLPKFPARLRTRAQWARVVVPDKTDAEKESRWRDNPGGLFCVVTFDTKGP